MVHTDCCGKKEVLEALPHVYICGLRVFRTRCHELSFRLLRDPVVRICDALLSRVIVETGTIIENWRYDYAFVTVRDASARKICSGVIKLRIYMSIGHRDVATRRSGSVISSSGLFRESYQKNAMVRIKVEKLRCSYSFVTVRVLKCLPGRVKCC